MSRKRQTCPSTGLGVEGCALWREVGIRRCAPGEREVCTTSKSQLVLRLAFVGGPCFFFGSVVFLCLVRWLAEVCALPQREPDAWSCPTGTRCVWFGRQRGERKMGWCQTRCPDASRMRHSAVSEGAL